MVGAKIRPITAPSSVPLPTPADAPAKPPQKTGAITGFAAPETPFEADTPRANVPYLRLVKNDE